MSIFIAEQHKQTNMNKILIVFGRRRYPLVLDGLFSRLLLTLTTEELQCTHIPNFTTSGFEQQKIRFKCLNGRTQAVKSEVLKTLPSDIIQK
jgi:hypothetical protein